MKETEKLAASMNWNELGKGISRNAQQFGKDIYNGVQNFDLSDPFGRKKERRDKMVGAGMFNTGLGVMGLGVGNRVGKNLVEMRNQGLQRQMANLTGQVLNQRKNFAQAVNTFGGHVPEDVMTALKYKNNKVLQPIFGRQARVARKLVTPARFRRFGPVAALTGGAIAAGNAGVLGAKTLWNSFKEN